MFAKVSTSIVFVLNEPYVLPMNPFHLLDAGLFTREEVSGGPMDFGPGYVLKSAKGFMLAREVNRIVIVFTFEKSTDFTFVDLITRRVQDALKLRIKALGVNFRAEMEQARMQGVSSAIDAIASRVANTEIDSKSCDFSYVDGGIRKTVSLNMSLGRVEVSINNHIVVDSATSVGATLRRVEKMYDSFASIVSSVEG